ncbi:hypothetical protein HYH03_008596 [Edaphochlamys debaryana]|uniref:GHMP kinase N-terminal domain-containing protein n=1 Tax=Edaphochlamys debaryana TaxID=47281 RepID=A0A835Y8W6_9CHLO|nr:hypothetical protein HYH03_008596 [Edaphochlamys debaryana]|eukprot:KAG2493174.1 hypothetical protein HYH03_008596 [Edaphochlamys debaryana]
MGDAIVHRTNARSGLFGNPSDQYHGRCITFSLANFYAEVTLTPGPEPGIRIQPHPVHDSTEWGSMDELLSRTSTQGLYGGVRLLTAACKRFAEYCRDHGVRLEPPASRKGMGFTLSYETTVPRQTGMAGSSAIIYSTIKCLLDWYGLGPEDLPYAARPGLILSVEAGELGINAGLQDRVIQVYGGLVHLDFDAAHMKAHGGAGRYTRLDPALLPPLHIMYSENPSESGKVHSGVKARWMAGDPEVRALMTRVAQCGDEGLRLLTARGQAADGAEADRGEKRVHLEGDAREADGVSTQDRALADLMTANFRLRHALFGDEVLGARNLRMVELAKSAGAGVNFTGSGGATVVFCPRGRQQAEELRAAAEAEGFVLVEAVIGPETAPL